MASWDAVEERFTGSLAEGDNEGLVLSLALDGLLDEAEAAEFERQLAADGALHATWQQWTGVDGLLRSAQHVAAPVGLASRIQAQLERQHRRARLRAGVLVGVAAMLLWGSAGLALAGMISLLVAQEWVGVIAPLDTLSVWWQALQSAVAVLASAGRVLLNAPEAGVALACYVVGLAAMAGVWIAYLRRSLRPAPNGAELPPGAEAHLRG